MYEITFRTSVLRRLLNYFKRSKKHFFTNLIEEFIRAHAGHFSHPIGSRVSLIFMKKKEES